ncbi:MAG TPA: hypothetical protein VFY76_18660 [Nocardioides sp.]|nr:hypothetical protein [Nocardioides sp.]
MTMMRVEHQRPQPRAVGVVAAQQELRVTNHPGVLRVDVEALTVPRA